MILHICNVQLLMLLLPEDQLTCFNLSSIANLKHTEIGGVSNEHYFYSIAVCVCVHSLYCVVAYAISIKSLLLL